MFVLYKRHFILTYNTQCKSKNKLELCAFALKGEHNVYSLVPNIHVCIILTKSEFISSCIRPAVSLNIVQITHSTFL